MEQSEQPLKGKVALVTGSTRGIGRAIAIELAKQGAQVFGTATKPEGAQAISEMLAFASAPGTGLVLDVCEEGAGERVLASVESTAGHPVDILVNNAGLTADGLALRMSMADWDRVIATNLTAVFRLSQMSLRGMLKSRWGRIIQIGSVVGATGNPGQVNYCAAKAGLIGLVKSLAREVASRGITVNIVAPGFIATDMTEGLDAVHKAQLLDSIPVKRMGRPEDVAAAVAFLVSEGASYITGETLHVNGGLFMA